MTDKDNMSVNQDDNTKSVKDNKVSNEEVMRSIADLRKLVLNQGQKHKSKHSNISKSAQDNTS